MNPFVFIVGCPRSGTTLLKRMMNAHRDIAITRETHWITQLLKGENAVSPNMPVTHALVSRLLTHKRFIRMRGDFTRMRVDQTALERLLALKEPVTFAQLVTAVFDLYGEGAGKRLVGDKTPRYVRHVANLHDLWPEAKFVHLIRDGRDVCSSVLNWDKGNRAVIRMSTWEQDPVSTTALWWEQLVRLGREDGTALGPQLYHELRYEALVSEPVKTCEALCAFLGVPYDERMLRFHEGRTRDDPALDAKHAWRPVTQGLRTWRSEMTHEDLERFEAAAGELLDELDYARAVPDPSPRAKRHATAVRDSFVREARRQRLPERWQR
jgi:hypothetical protein